MVLRQPINSEHSDNIDVSICIANYNGAEIIAACIDSVLSQSGNLAIEIIIHDDASTDSSVETIRKNYLGKVHLITSASNVGFCVSNNRMVEIARGRYILLLNNDAALLPDALMHLFSYAQHNEGILTLPQYDWDSNAIVDRGCLLDPFYNPTPNLDIDRTDVAMVIGACLWLPKQLWEQLGGFPTWIESIGEDLFICCKARTLGYPVQVLKSSGYRHRQGHSFGGNKVRDNKLSSSMRRRRLSERNKTYAMCIFTPAFTLFALFPIHAFLLILEGIVIATVMRKPSILSKIYMNAIFASFHHASLLQLERKVLFAQPGVDRSAYFHALTWLPRKLEMVYRYGLPRLR